MYVLLLQNLMIHLAHRGHLVAMVRRAPALIAYQARRTGKRSGEVWEARETLRKLVMRKSGTVEMRCTGSRSNMTIAAVSDR